MSGSIESTRNSASSASRRRRRRSSKNAGNDDTAATAAECPERPPLKFETLALIASGLGAAGLVPQIIRIWKMGNADQISPLYLIVSITASVLWIVFGAANNIRPDIVAGVVLLILYGIIVTLKIYFVLNPRDEDATVDDTTDDVVSAATSSASTTGSGV